MLKHSHPHRGLQPGGMVMVLSDFSKHFKQFLIDLPTAKKRFPLVNKVFNKHWRPYYAKKTYTIYWILNKQLGGRHYLKKTECARPVNPFMEAYLTCFLVPANQK